MTLVKVCGLTREADVDAAVRSGAWAVGFILARSPRQVAPARAARLAARVPLGVLTIGVFTVEKANAVAESAVAAGLRGVQLSAGMRGPSVPAVRAALSTLGVTDMAVIAAPDTPGIAKADFALYDSRSRKKGATVFGGTGQTLDWDALARDLKHQRRTSQAAAVDRVVLAGGLTPANVRKAVLAVHPLVVDVNSGVEKAPGEKDTLLLTRLFTTLRGADAQIADHEESKE